MRNGGGWGLPGGRRNSALRVRGAAPNLAPGKGRGDANMLADKKILLIISGGIAAYKALDLIRRLRSGRCGVVPVLTRAAEEFVTPLTVSALAGEKVYRDLFDLTDEAEMGHIELSRAADLVVVAPATADLMAKMAGGHANDLASTLLMATDKPVLIAPAMNVKMWEHPATQENLGVCKGDGIRVVGPEAGRWPAASSGRAVCPKCRRSSPPSRRLSGPGRLRASCAGDLGADP
jgi:phosphopantothenoylcysteine synthetase/decarboxylase